MLSRYCTLALMLSLPLLSAQESVAQQKPGRDSACVYFRFNQYTLNDSTKAHIDEAIYQRLIDDHSPISIIGYADFVGGEGYNLNLSRRRANAVKNYLVASGFRRKSITIIIGKGKVERPGLKSNNGYAPDRRVDIVHSRDAVSAATRKLTIIKSRRDTLLPRGTFSELTNIATLQPGQTLLLDKIFFYPGRHIIREASEPTLEELYNTLQENPGLKIRIEGHVCCIRRGVPDALDEDTGGLVLSANRARAIRQWLINKGINSPRLETKGFGKSMPIIQDEVTEEEANKNRRVEIRILEK